MRKKKSNPLHLLLFLALIFLGCTREKKEDYKKDAISMHQRLISELQSIHSLNEAQSHESTLKNLFLQFSNLMITIDRYCEKIGCGLEFEPEEKTEAFALQQELERLMTIPGVEEVLKRSQEPGFRRLEKYLTVKNLSFSE